MKKLIFIVLALGLIVNSQAQIKFGVRGGISSSSISLKNDIIDLDPQSTDDLVYSFHAGTSKIGLHFGGMAQVHLLGFFIMPEVLITTNRDEIQVEKITVGAPSVYEITEQKFTKLSVPVTMGAKFGPLRLGAGPVMNRVLNSSSDLIDELTSINASPETFEDVYWGWQAGVGFDLGKMAFDLKYEGSFTALGNGINVGGEDIQFETKPKNLIFSLGFYF